jgi:hypothetical protein
MPKNKALNEGNTEKEAEEKRAIDEKLEENRRKIRLESRADGRRGQTSRGNDWVN